MEQVPTMPTTVTVDPDTVQIDGVAELNVTGKFEVAVAVTTKGNELVVWPDKALKLMVWLACVTANDCVTCDAANVALPSPAWLAAIVQLPAARSVTVEPETVHTDGVRELKETAKVEFAVAVIVKGAAPYTWLGKVEKVIVCGKPISTCTTFDSAMAWRLSVVCS